MEFDRKQGNHRTNEVKNAKLALANKLKKANPDMDFKTASSMVADTVKAATSSSASDSSGRSSKRAKRSHDESFNEEEDSQVQTPADQVKGQPQGGDSILVSDEAQADHFTQSIDHAQPLDHQDYDQDQQPAGMYQSNDQVNNHVASPYNHQVQPWIEQADYPVHDDQPAMMQQGESFSHQVPQAP